jgi:hypothetical protein
LQPGGQCAGRIDFVAGALRAFSSSDCAGDGRLLDHPPAAMMLSDLPPKVRSTSNITFVWRFDPITAWDGAIAILDTLLVVRPAGTTAGA